MISKTKIKFANGTEKTQIRVVESYRPGPGINPKKRTIKSFGYLEDQENEEAFWKMVKDYDQTWRKEKSNRIEIPTDSKMYSTGNRRMNYGYKFLECIYNQLGVEDFIGRYLENAKYRGKYPVNEIFKFLVLSRILLPDSKRGTSQRQNEYYGFDTRFALEDVYRSLDHFSSFSIPIQQYLNEKIKDIVGRDLSYAFYDVTNYYFEKDLPDEDGGLRKRGVSKEHRVDPIVQMGLFIDSKGLPVTMELFPGNTSDTLTLSPVMKQIKDNYGLGRLIVVADKGLNSSSNINEIVNNGDGYVVSQVLRGKKGKRYHEAMFDEKGYIENPDGSYKYKLYTEEYEGKDTQGKPLVRQRQVLIYWNKADADFMAAKRNEKLKLAERMTKNSVYEIPKGGKEYLSEKVIDRETGKEVEKPKKVRSVNLKKAEADARFDGFFCILTSEMGYDEREIRGVYGGLWKIEESFRILKSDLSARPVFVQTNEHIRAHFLICFVALLIVRLFQLKMSRNALSVERIARSLNAATCQILTGGYVHLDDVGGSLAFKEVVNESGKSVKTLAFSNDDEIALDYALIQKAFHSDFYFAYPKIEVFNKFLKQLSF